MNKYFLSLIVALAFFSCAQKDEYTIKGTASGDFDGKTVSLIYTRPDGVEQVDTAVIQNGKFSFKGKQETPEIYFVTLDDVSEEYDDPIFKALLVEPGTITVDIRDYEMRIGGTKANESFQKMMDAEKDVYDEMQQMEDKYRDTDFESFTEEERSKISGEFMVLQEKIKNINLDFIKENINNPLGENMFLSLADRLTLEEMDAVFENAGDEFKSKNSAKALQGVMDTMRKVSVGQKFTDFTMESPDGKEVSLSDYAGKGKYTLVDFWASWCGPCLREMPTLIRAYDMYKNKNFEIVGVSLDNIKEEWIAGIKKANITWPQMSDLKEWQTEARVIYNFNSIPHTILLDPDGIIIAKDLRGQAFLDKLKELID